jgi:hypothetical protein
MDDAKIVAEEELELSPAHVEIFLSAYASCTEFSSVKAEISSAADVPTLVKTPEEALRAACQRRDLKELANAMALAIRAGLSRSSELMFQARELEQNLLREQELVEMLSAKPETVYLIESEMKTMGIAEKYQQQIQKIQKEQNSQKGPAADSPRARKSTAMTCKADTCGQLHRYGDGYCNKHRQLASGALQLASDVGKQGVKQQTKQQSTSSASAASASATSKPANRLTSFLKDTRGTHFSDDNLFAAANLDTSAADAENIPLVTINVMGMDGSTLALEVPQQGQVSVLKEEIGRRMGAPPRCQQVSGLQVQ